MTPNVSILLYLSTDGLEGSTTTTGIPRVRYRLWSQYSSSHHDHPFEDRLGHGDVRIRREVLLLVSDRVRRLGDY